MLGDHQDAVVAAERMRAVLGSLDAEAAFVAGRIVEREQQRRAQARADWPGLVAAVDQAAGKLR